MFESPKPPNNAHYDGLHDRLPEPVRTQTGRDFITMVYMNGEHLLGPDANHGLFSESTSKIMAGMDEMNPPDILMNLTGDGAGPGSEAYAESLRILGEVDPEFDSPEEPKEW